MQSSSKDFLQRQVALSTAVGAVLLAAISFLRRALFFSAIDGSLLVSFLHPAVSLVILVGIVFGLSAVHLSTAGRLFQVGVLLIGSVFAASQAPSGDLTSSVFFGLGLLLAGEYGYLSGRRIIAFLVAGAVFTVSLAYGSYKVTGKILTVAHTLLGTALVAFLFIAVVRTRLQEIAMREARLEELVRNRTSQLQEEIDRRAVLEMDLRSSAETSSALAKDRALLLHELHHRTKNDLQLVSSLLRLHSEQFDSAKMTDALRAAEDRINAIALVHEHLYGSDSLASIDLQDYLEGLVGYYQATRPAGAVRIIHEMSGKTAVGLEPAVHIGLVVNELVLNSMKHGFPDRKEGTIAVRLEEVDDAIQLEVSDDGVGFRECFDITAPPSIGIEIVNALVGQLNGTIQLARSPTTTWTVTIPVRDRK